MTTSLQSGIRVAMFSALLPAAKLAVPVTLVIWSALAPLTLILNVPLLTARFPPIEAIVPTLVLVPGVSVPPAIVTLLAYVPVPVMIVLVGAVTAPDTVPLLVNFCVPARVKPPAAVIPPTLSVPLAPTVRLGDPLRLLFDVEEESASVPPLTVVLPV